jgi:3',5'-nucleoside bisphosphate phosphatase
MTNKKYIDLHMHTNYSDGIRLSPRTLVATMAFNDINILAVTDHDNLAAYGQAKIETDRYGIILVPGVELTTSDYHLLGLGFEFTREFRDFVDYSRELQGISCGKRIELLQNLGVPISFEKVRREFPESRLGKLNIFTTMLRDEECREFFRQKHQYMNNEEIFKHYLGKKGLASNLVDRQSVSVEEAIAQVHGAGGIIGIAHPVKDINHMSEMEILLSQGIDFMEIQPNLRHMYDYAPFEEFARKNNLPVSYGSDYHGPVMSRKPMARGENILTEGLAKLLGIENETRTLQDCALLA